MDARARWGLRLGAVLGCALALVLIYQLRGLLLLYFGPMLSGVIRLSSP